MRRGFKAEAERTGVAIREQLGIKHNEPLDCIKLVESLGIPIIPVLTSEQIETICYADGKDHFSAVTISVPNGHLIIYNQTHSFARTNSTLAHEASHLILKHEFSLISKLNICREFDKEKEDEANWLSSCLLMPEKGLIWAVLKGMKLNDIADHFTVSHQMAQWRYSSTGMKQRAKYIKYKNNF